jgi:maleate isomerase
MPDDLNRAQPADGLGYRAKIGILIPATNTICQPECEMMRPAGVTNHIARMRPVPRGAETGDMEAYRRSLRQDTSSIKEAIESVNYCKPDLIILGHSIDTFRDGLSGAAGLKRDLQEAADGTAVILPSHAFLVALAALGIEPGRGKRIAILSPYWPPADEQVLRFFGEAGYEITRVLGLKRPSAVAIAETPVSAIVEGLRDLAADRPDIIIEPGTNLPTATLAREASAWLGLPVLSCNVATYWHALRTLGIRDKAEGLGPLFQFH